MVRMLALAVALLVCLPALGQEKGQPGRFDYYVLALSWSPSWCATQVGRADKEQCGQSRPKGFVVHGLWPQYGDGGYPAQCAVPGKLSDEMVARMLDVMPSRRLVDHEWRRHGTCDGGEPEPYFGRIRDAYQKIRIPKAFDAPVTPQTMSVAEVEKLFAAANPGLDGKSVAVVCRGRAIAEVRICLDKDLNYRACGRDVSDRCKGKVSVPVAP